jgi:hypothetical protein
MKLRDTQINRLQTRLREFIKLETTANKQEQATKHKQQALVD